jgi:hypothetical protein
MSFSIRIWFSAFDAAFPNLPANPKRQKRRSPDHQAEADINPAVDVWVVFRPGESVTISTYETQPRDKTEAKPKRQ